MKRAKIRARSTFALQTSERAGLVRCQSVARLTRIKEYLYSAVHRPFSSL